MQDERRGGWLPTIIVFIAGGIATALVPLAVPILGPLSREFGVGGAQLGWMVSLPSFVCAFGALLLGIMIDRVGDVRVLLAGAVLALLGDLGVSVAPNLSWFVAARVFQGLSYGCLSVAGPAFIQRTIAPDQRRAAMAFWAAHTPLGFAAAVFFGAQIVAAGLSWRYAFVGHAVAALAIGLAFLSLRHTRSSSRGRRSTGLRDVLGSHRSYAVAIGAMGTALLQTGVMVTLPTILASRFGFSTQLSALAIVAAMLANWAGAMLIASTRIKLMPRIALPLSTIGALTFYMLTMVWPASIAVDLCGILLFSIFTGAANALVWSLVPAAVPFPEASGATAGLVTQGSFLGVLTGPPIFFATQGHPSATYLLILALFAAPQLALLASASRSPVGRCHGDEPSSMDFDN